MRRLLPVLSVLLIVAGLPPAADGAQRVGPALGDGDLNTSCVTTCLRVNARGAAVVVAADGVLTRWRVRIEGSSLAGSATLRVLRPVGGYYAMLALRSSAPLSVQPSDSESVVEAPTRLSVREGDVLGIETTANVHTAEYTVPGAAISEFIPPMDDTKDSDADTAYTNSLAGVGGDVEPDVDRDGFGDETQDGCPRDPSTQGACPAPPGLPNPPPPPVVKHLDPPTLVAAGIKLDRRARRITATFACPANRASACTGTAEAVTAKAVRVRRGAKAKLLLGSTRFTAQPGQQARLRIRLTTGARALLRRSKRVRLAVRLQSSDARTTSARRTVRVPTSARPS